jgi:hypothetical protein
MSVPCRWVIDPWHRIADAAGPDGTLNPISDRLTVPGALIALEVEAIFAELDRLERRASASK